MEIVPRFTQGINYSVNFRFLLRFVRHIWLLTRTSAISGFLPRLPSAKLVSCQDFPRDSTSCRDYVYDPTSCQDCPRDPTSCRDYPCISTSCRDYLPDSASCRDSRQEAESRKQYRQEAVYYAQQSVDRKQQIADSLAEAKYDGQEAKIGGQVFVTHWTRISLSISSELFRSRLAVLSLGSESCLSLSIIALYSPIMLI